MNYPNRIALVTGASSGLGVALCQELRAKNWTVIAVARSKDKLEALQEKLGVYPIVCDVADREAVQDATRQLQEQKLCPALFFLNAALTGEAAVESSTHLDIDKHRKMMDVNYFGVLFWIEAWQSMCEKNGGANFVVTCSVNAIFAPPLVVAYSASKAAIAKAFEGLSVTLAETNLLFSVVYAGPIDTPGLKVPRKLPFTWKADDMAKYMLKCALQQKQHCEPSLFYSTVARFFHWLPSKWTQRILDFLRF